MSRKKGGLVIRKLILIALAVGGIGCANGESSKPSSVSGPSQEVQFTVPDDFIGILENKPIHIAIGPAIGGRTDNPLYGLGNQNLIKYNSFNCYMTTRMVENYRTNFYYFIIEQRIDYTDRMNPVPNDVQCDQLIGNFWIHHNGNDYENLLFDPMFDGLFIRQNKAINMEITRE
jgi:hypothetical protein